MQSKEVKKWQDEEALKRYQMIAPLLDEDLDEAKRSFLYNSNIGNSKKEG